MILTQTQIRQLFETYGLPVAPILTIGEDEVYTLESKLESWPLPTEAWSIKIVTSGDLESTLFSKRCLTQNQALETVINILSGKSQFKETISDQPLKILIEPQLCYDLSFCLGVSIDWKTSIPVVFGISAKNFINWPCVVGEKDGFIVEMVDMRTGLRTFQARRLASKLGLSGKLLLQVTDIIMLLYKIWDECNAWWVIARPVEIVKTVNSSEQKAVVKGGTIYIDDNSLFNRSLIKERLSDIACFRKSTKYQTIMLKGSIGCVSNGAGLGMATVDMINLYGGQVGCLIDLQGGISFEEAVEALSSIMVLEEVKALLVNMFGGIVECDIVAEALAYAAHQKTFSRPIIIRMEGLNASKALRIIESSGLNYKYVSELKAAIELAIRSVK